MRKTLAIGSCIAALLASISVRAQLNDPEFFRDQKTGSAPLERGDRPSPTSEVIVCLRSGVNPYRFAQLHRMRFGYALRGVKDTYVFKLGSVLAAEEFQTIAKGDPMVRSCYNNARAANKKFGFTPNDPFFFNGNPTAAFPGQWYLVNSTGLDAHVQGAWDRDLTGSGVVLGLVDDCLQTTHPDLAPNYSPSNSFDFGQNDGDPDPVNATDQHGVSVAGVAAARGGNGIGVCGTAPFAGLAGLRVDFETQTVAMFVNATLYHSSGGDTTIKVKNHSYGQSPPYGDATAESNACDQSAQSGTIHVFSAGNERGDVKGGEDSNKKMPQNNPSVITVAALASNGKYAPYSSFGANVFVTAPSSGSGTLRIVTTDRMTKTFGYNGNGDTFPDPDYTSLFGGTSSAAPVVSGIMALGKQAQPALNGRFAKHILAMTSTVVDPSDNTVASDGGWRTNAAGYHFNQNYGFGLINADQFTQVATNYSGVTPLETESIGTQNVGVQLPDNDPNGVSRSFTISSSTPLEEVQVYLNVTHTFRGDVEAYLTSPSGTTSRLMLHTGQDNGDSIDWTFESNAFWGENPHGLWVLNVRDVAPGDTGTWNSFDFGVRMGKLIANQGTVGSVTLSPGAVYGGSKTRLSCTVTLTQPAGPGGQKVNLSSSNTSALSVPASITVNEGSTSATFQVQHRAVSSPSSVMVTATIGGSSAAAGVSILPNPVRTITLSPRQAVGGSSTIVKATVSLIGPAGPNGTVVVLGTSDSAVASTPQTVLVPAGFSKISFVVTHHTVTSSQSVQIRATANGITKERSLIVNP